MKYVDVISDEPKEPHPGRFQTVWVIAMTAVVLVSGMIYSLWWPDVVRHQAFYWIVPGDIWSTIRAAHFVGWGGLSFIYTYQSALVTLPGYAVVLSPVVAMGAKLHLTETAPGFPGPPKPTMWLLVGPFTMACSALALFAMERLGRHLKQGVGVRRVVIASTAVAVWPAIVFWGHVEDVIALGFLVFALVQALSGRWRTAGYLLGLALVMQLYVLIVVPLFIGLVGLRRTPELLFRAAVIPAFLFVFVFFPHFHQASRVIFDQPSYPTVDHATPWVALAPRLAKGVVAAGPSRLGAFAVGIWAGWMASRHRQNASMIIWLAAAGLTARCLFESVMVPYYVMPGVILALVSAASVGRKRLGVAALAGLAVTAQTHFHAGEWAYFSEMSGLFLVVLAAAWPGTYRLLPRRSSPVHVAPVVNA